MTSSDDAADVVDESFDADSLLKYLGEILDAPPPSSPALTSRPLNPQPLTSWTTAIGNDEPEIAGQPETEVIIWTGSQVHVPVADLVSDYDSPMTSDDLGCLTSALESTIGGHASDQPCDVSSLISLPVNSISSYEHPDSKGIIMNSAQILGLFSTGSSMDTGSSLDTGSSFDALFPLDSSYLCATPLDDGNQDVSVAMEAMPDLNTAVPRDVFEMESSREEAASGGKRLAARCMSDSEVMGEVSFLTRQGSKRHKRASVGSRASRDHRQNSDISSSGTDDPFAAGESLAAADARLLRRREQNRRAARVCRERKRAMSASMAKEYEDLVSSNTTLQLEIHQLQQEEQTLTSLLERHLQNCTTMTSPASTSHIRKSLREPKQESDH